MQIDEEALQLLCERAVSRTAFGKPLARLGGNIDIIANARMDIEQARLLTLKAAYMMDTEGNKAARSEIAMISGSSDDTITIAMPAAARSLISL